MYLRSFEKMPSLDLLNTFDHLTLQNVIEVFNNIDEYFNNTPEAIELRNKQFMSSGRYDKYTYSDGKTKEDWDRALEKHLANSRPPDYDELFKSKF